MYPFSLSVWIYGGEPVGESIARLRRHGYDAVELLGEPRTADHVEIRRALSDSGLRVSSVAGAFSLERDLSSGSEVKRRAAVDYARESVDMVSEYGGTLLIVLPSPVGKTRPDVSCDMDWQHSVESVRKAGEHAAKAGIKLAIEPINRFETFLVNKLEVAQRFVHAVGLANVGLMADAFHMNIEERCPAEALRSVARELIHFHVADSNREAAGRGHTDWRELLGALKEIEYRGYLAVEFLPASASPYDVIGSSTAGAVMEQFTKESIGYLKSMLNGEGA